MKTSSFRRAPENPRFRLVDREDLVTGARITKVDHDAGPYQLAHPYQTIVLDDVPVLFVEGVTYVLFRCSRPIWEGQCFVPLDSFVGEVRDFYDARYWLLVNP